ncbi:hypothetical protein HN587_05365 [Candidatus Woesearchaeota archaeon]|jgi:hypothetical protein|nr:hypothetical protein [Candidatus Woesearchaeota archaeon]
MVDQQNMQTPPGMPPPQTGPGGMPAGMQPSGAPKKGGFSLFGPSKKPGAMAGGPKTDYAGEINNLSRRLMTLEERYTNLRKKTQVTDQNMLNNNKKIMTEIGAIHEEMKELKKEMTDLTDKMKIMVRELKDCAKRNEVQSLAKYVDLWNPINFVTRDAVLRIIKDEVESQFKDLNIKMQEEAFIKEQIKIEMRELKNNNLDNNSTQLKQNEKKIITEDGKEVIIE